MSRDPRHLLGLEGLAAARIVTWLDRAESFLGGATSQCLDGKVIGMASVGESAPGPVVLKHFGFTADNIKATLEAML